MSDMGVGESKGVDGASSVGNSDDGVSAAEADGIADDATKAPDDAAQAEAAALTADNPVDTVEVAGATPGTTPAEVAAETPPAAPVEEPSILETAATWTGQTLKGYATGAINGVLDLANLTNKGVNAGLGLVGVDPVFQTDMHLAPATKTEEYAQNAMTAATMVAGVAGMVKSAPAMARALDGGLAWGKSALGLGAVEAPVVAGSTKAAALGDLSAAEIARIQAGADQLGQDLYVVGSAAKGARRNVGSDLPLAEFGGPKLGTRSDIDYATRLGYDDAASALPLPDVDPSWGVRGVNYLNLDNSPAIRFSPGKPPELLSGGGRLNLD